VTCAHLGCNITAIQKQLIGITSGIKEMSGKSTSVTDSTHCITKAILCLGINDVNCISEEVFDGQINTSIDTILYRPSVKIHFPTEFQVIPNTFLFISYYSVLLR
jgi:hypothetical protein